MSPEYVFMSTELGSGRPFVFARSMTSLMLAKYDGMDLYSRFDIENRLVAEAVAASSAFPGVVDPITLRADDRKSPGTISFVEGGVLDNTGLLAVETVSPDSHYPLVSDGRRVTQRFGVDAG